MAERRLGFIGAFGFYTVWVTVSYLCLAAVGYGFIPDLMVLGYRVPCASFFSEAIQRRHSELEGPLSRLRTARNVWGHQQMMFDEVTRNGRPPLFAAGRLALHPAVDWEQALPTTASGSQVHSVYRDAMGDTQAKVWLTWKSGNFRELPGPDPYGFPILPAVSLGAARSMFPSLSSFGAARNAGASDPGFSYGLESVARLDTQVWLTPSDGHVSYPLLWRHNQLTRLIEHKHLGVCAFAAMVVLGLLVTIWLVVASPLDQELIGYLRSAGYFMGVAMGISAVVLIPNFRTCYRPSITSDADEVDQATVERMKRDCRQYLDVLQREQKLSNDERKLVESLLAQR